jgi:hypothetical protein
MHSQLLSALFSFLCEVYSLQLLNENFKNTHLVFKHSSQSEPFDLKETFRNKEIPLSQVARMVQVLHFQRKLHFVLQNYKISSCYLVFIFSFLPPLSSYELIRITNTRRLPFIWKNSSMRYPRDTKLILR